ncbi:GNAT family N-acetyltransferase [Reinekea sp.]|jgi:ribosomal protein S18 acetylase RimI-like enzyme|uniref:GNAT family N-acetyltransferase n=1 Tax=Reinekea sp. TaxID=1970455 RepID=UPI003989858A
MKKVRVLEPNDSLAYRKLRLEALQTNPEYFGSSYDQQKRLDKLYFESLIEQRSAKGTMLGAYIEGKLVGMCGIAYETQLIPSAAEIIQMYVTPEFQGLGLGRLLILEAERFSKSDGVRFLVLEVFKHNRKAVSLYETAGFQIDSTLASNGDSHFMTLSIA